MAAVHGQFTLPLLAFQHHVGQLYIDPAEIQFVRELRQSDLAVVEQGRWHKADGTDVNIVCKVWRPFVVATPQDFRELLLEASKLQRLQDPNLTRFLGLGCFAHGSLAEVRESMFMVEQYVGSRTLRKVISEQARCRHRNLYDARTAIRWASQVASALASLHEQHPPYVHNDVKADNVFLTDTPRLAAADAKLGDLKPHRHVYDREPSTLSRHQQQQRLLSPKSAAASGAAHPSGLMQPRFTLERISSCSSGSEHRAQSWSSIASSTAGTAAAAPSQQQQQQQDPGLPPVSHGFMKQQQQQPLTPASETQAQHMSCQLSEPLQQHQRHGFAFVAGQVAPGCLPAAADGSWSSCCSADGTPAAAAAAAAAPEAVQRARSLPVPIVARGSHQARGSSCPSDWNPGVLGRQQSDSAAEHAAEAAAAASATSSYLSASSQRSISISSASMHSSSSIGLGLASSASCTTSAPTDPHSLAAEIAAADAAADAAAGAAAAEASSPSWRAAAQQRSAVSFCLSDGASSTRGRRSQCTCEPGSLAADAEAEDHSPTAQHAAPEAVVVVRSSSGKCMQQAPQAPQQHSTAGGRQRQQQPDADAQRDGTAARVKGGLATAIASHQQQQRLQLQQQEQHQSRTTPDVASVDQQQAPPSPWQGLLSGLYRHSKSSPLEEEATPHHSTTLQLARSAPDVLAASDDEAVHHGAFLMPLQLSEPTGLCSLQTADSGTRRHRTSSNGGGDASAAAVKLRSNWLLPSARHQQVQQQQAAAVGTGAPVAGPPDGSAGNGCVYYGWELLPSGAASPCGAVHSSLLDMFADVADEEVVTSRRYRDSCHYTIVPGSLVQQRSVPATASPLLLSGSAPLSRSKSASTTWEPPSAPAFNSTASCISSTLGSAGSRWGASTAQQGTAAQQQQPGSEQLERAPSVSKGYAPSTIESKQHGGNSAFAALTAIDCITEEGSSVATDSCAPSCAASRESTAHGGAHFYSTSPVVHEAPEHTALQQQQQQQSPAPTLLNMGSLSKALSLSALLRQRSGGARLGATDSSGSGGKLAELDDAKGDDSSSSTRSPPASPRDGSLHSTAQHGSQSSPVAASSPPKKQLLHLLVSATSGSPRAAHGGEQGDESALTALMTHPTQDSKPAGDQLQEHAQHGNLTLAAAAAAGGHEAEATAAAPVKRVRFSLQRPEGLTASRDFSLLYAAPELVRGERPTEKVDVFAFGMVLYELLSRRLLASSVAEVCSRNSSKRGSRHSRQHHQQQPDVPTPAQGSDSDDGEQSLPEHQLLLTYAQLVAAGYRPPILPHFPDPVASLIRGCWAPEPHERPQMSDVLLELQAWQKNRRLLSALNSFVPELADMGFAGGRARQPACCVIS